VETTRGRLDELDRERDAAARRADAAEERLQTLEAEREAWDLTRRDLEARIETLQEALRAAERKSAVSEPAMDAEGAPDDSAYRDLIINHWNSMSFRRMLRRRR